MKRCCFSNLIVSLFCPSSVEMNSIKRFLTIRHRVSLVSSRKIFFDVHPEVQNAIKERRPVVACETAILTHGLPRPINVDTCFKIEQIIRENGSTPATIGIIDGRIKVGLSFYSIILLAFRLHSNI